MKIVPLGAHLGAEIIDVDLSSPIGENLAAELRQALADRQVLFLKGQPLSAQQQLGLARVFGEPMADAHPKFGCVDGIGEVSLVVNDRDNPPDINVWHTDTTFRDPPAGTCVLHCVEMPLGGSGDTIWASMFAAYDRLSELMKTFLGPLRAYHQLPLDGRPPELLQTVLGKPISATHPVIRWVPEAKRNALFVNRVYTQRIEGLSREESDAVLEGLFAIAESPDHQYRYSWQVGDTAIWDNRSTQHFAVADYWPQRRIMHRVAVAGEDVIAADCPGKEKT